MRNGKVEDDSIGGAGGRDIKERIKGRMTEKWNWWAQIKRKESKRNVKKKKGWEDAQRQKGGVDKEQMMVRGEDKWNTRIKRKRQTDDGVWGEKQSKRRRRKSLSNTDKETRERLIRKTNTHTSERGKKERDSGGLSSAAVTHRLYSAPRNKFSGFRHTLHSAGGRQTERTTVVMSVEGKVDTEPPRHTSKGLTVRSAIRPTAAWLAIDLSEHSWQGEGPKTPQRPKHASAQTLTAVSVSAHSTQQINAGYRI